MTTRLLWLVLLFASLVMPVACSSWSTSTDVGDLTTRPFVGRGFSFDLPKDWNVEERDAEALKVSHHNFMAIIGIIPLGATDACDAEASRRELAGLAAQIPLTDLKGIADAREPLTWQGTRAQALRAHLTGGGTDYFVERHSWCGLTISGAPVRGELVVLPQGRADVFATHIAAFHQLVSTLKVKDWHLPRVESVPTGGVQLPAPQ